jgi:hypothetical protein
MPNNGTERPTIDFIRPCGQLANPVAPDTALRVFRRALANEADGSVVMVETGFQQNLADLLASPPDSISPLSGRDLVARKVRSLVIMGGGYPSRSGETNLSGDAASAQQVASSWPTRIVWAGYEVGDAIHTGDTITGTHPTSSPVRVSYETFVGPNRWIFSYDLVAAFHAVRSNDPSLSLVGPGTNVVNSSGANTFTTGSGNQYYLRLQDGPDLEDAIEALLGTVPGGNTPDTTAPAISQVAVGSIGSTGATITWATDEPSDSQVQYGTTTNYGSNSPLDATLVHNHTRTLSNLTPGTTYQYRVRSRDAAGNLATSGNLTFTTTSSTASPAPNDDFNGTSLDLTRWVAVPEGSTVAVANNELAITHPAGGWTRGTLRAATAHDQRGRALQVQVKRAANDGRGGTTFGETTVRLALDSTHEVSFFIAGGALTAWVVNGSSEVNLTPSWPTYNPTQMQWLRFREAGGTLFWEYAAGATAPGTWTTLASTPNPFSMSAVTLSIVAGSNLGGSDAARFDNISTT